VPTDRQAEQTPGFRPGMVEGLIPDIPEISLIVICESFLLEILLICPIISKYISTGRRRY